MKSKPVRIAQPGAQQLPGLALAIGADDMRFLLWRPAARIAQRRRSIDDRLAGGFHRVAMNGIDEAIGTEGQVVTSVADAARELPQPLQIFHLSIFRESQAKHGLGIIRVGVEAAVDIDEAPAFRQIDRDGLDPRHRAAIVRQGHPQKARIFAEMVARPASSNARAIHEPSSAAALRTGVISKPGTAQNCGFLSGAFPLACCHCS